MHGILSAEKRERIIEQLPAIRKELQIATSLGPGVDLHDLFTGENLGIALVCLDDAYNRFIQVRMALYDSARFFL